MPVGQLPILSSVVTVYRDVVAAARAMPILFLAAAVVLFVFNILDLGSFPYLKERPLALFLIEVGIRLAESFLLTPFLIAIHRFILLDEHARGYPLEPLSARFERYYVWSLLLWFLMASVSLVVRPLVLGASPVVGLAIQFTATVMVAFVALRLSILFPAIAADAPAASSPNAFADTGGHVIRILLVLALAILPAIAVFFAMGLALFSPNAIEGEFSLGSALFAALTVALQLAVYALTVAAISRAFQAFASRLLKPPSS